MKKVHKKTDKKVKDRLRRHLRVRKKISGTKKLPRLAVFKSNSHIYGQIIDDVNGVTLVAVSSVNPDLRGELKCTSNKEAAEAVGKKLAELAKKKRIKNVVFDRGGFLFHGRIKAFADGAREGGLKF